MKSQKAHKFVLAILTFSRVTGPGASAKAVLWKTSGQKGGSGGAKDVSRVFGKTLTCNQEGKNGGSRKDAKEGKDSFLSREGRAWRLCVSPPLPFNLEPQTWNLEPGTWNLEHPSQPGTWNFLRLSRLTSPPRHGPRGRPGRRWPGRARVGRGWHGGGPRWTGGAPGSRQRNRRGRGRTGRLLPCR